MSLTILSYGESDELSAVLLLVVGQEEARDRSVEGQDHH